MKNSRMRSQYGVDLKDRQDAGVSPAHYPSCGDTFLAPTVSFTSLSDFILAVRCFP